METSVPFPVSARSRSCKVPALASYVTETKPKTWTLWPDLWTFPEQYFPPPMHLVR